MDMTIFGIVGLLIVSAGVLVKSRKDQDYLFIIGGLALGVYSYSLGNVIFIALQVIFILAAMFDLWKGIRR